MLSMDGMPELTFDLKNAQLMAEGYLSYDGELPDEMKMTFHVNGALSTGEDIELNIGTHVLLKVQDGELTQFKVWLPRLACLAQTE
ncbi:MAG: hypothetical protein ISF22_07130 [Methanomassiliicoccus sp.]|nr:hypothetical protein [Methanomassiliicoccus sp.]